MTHIWQPWQGLDLAHLHTDHHHPMTHINANFSHQMLPIKELIITDLKISKTSEVEKSPSRCLCDCRFATCLMHWCIWLSVLACIWCTNTWQYTWCTEVWLVHRSIYCTRVQWQCALCVWCSVLQLQLVAIWLQILPLPTHPHTHHSYHCSAPVHYL